MRSSVISSDFYRARHLFLKPQDLLPSVLTPLSRKKSYVSLCPQSKHHQLFLSKSQGLGVAHQSVYQFGTFTKMLFNMFCNFRLNEQKCIHLSQRYSICLHTIVTQLPLREKRHDSVTWIINTSFAYGRSGSEIVNRSHIARWSLCLRKTICYWKF